MEPVPDLEEWIVSSNDALIINLLAPSKSGLQTFATFNPSFTYPIFGDEEKIFGYKGLKINLRYRANDMRPHLKISHSKKLKPIGDAEPTDVAALLRDGNHLPKVAFVGEKDFEDSSKQQEENWTPPGTLHDSFDGPDGHYEVWRGSLEDPAVKQLNSRVQIFVPMFIEGGSYIGQKPESESSEPDLSDADRWTVFYLYRKDNPADGAGPGSYIFVGYSTVYRFYWFQPPTPPASPGDRWELPNGDTDLANLPCRTRLSQFVILPPFQGRGMGARLYNTIFQYYQDHKQTQEFTVEDPNEAFDHLRDVCDLTFLRSVPEFNNLRLDTSVTIPKSGPLPQLITNGDKLEALRQKTKIASRQFYRVLEMHLMSQLPESVRPKVDVDKVVPAPTKADRHQERLWELVAKQRLYRHNKEALSQIELDERIEKLSEVLQGVGFEYARLLEIYERSRQHSQNANGKRKLDDTSSTANKRPRTDDA